MAIAHTNDNHQVFSYKVSDFGEDKGRYDCEVIFDDRVGPQEKLNELNLPAQYKFAVDTNQPGIQSIPGYVNIDQALTSYEGGRLVGCVSVDMYNPEYDKSTYSVFEYYPAEKRIEVKFPLRAPDYVKAVAGVVLYGFLASTYRDLENTFDIRPWMLDWDAVINLGQEVFNDKYGVSIVPVEQSAN